MDIAYAEGTRDIKGRAAGGVSFRLIDNQKLCNFDFINRNYSMVDHKGREGSFKKICYNGPHGFAATGIKDTFSVIFRSRGNKQHNKEQSQKQMDAFTESYVI